MSMSSSHTKHWLEDMHDNIQVTRHPDHMGGEVTLFWSHHEKMYVSGSKHDLTGRYDAELSCWYDRTIVDSTRATVGGLDLCFGRWDTHDQYA
jgi:phospholipase D1/2